MSDFITRRALDDVEANLREKKEGKRKGFHIGVAVDGSEMSERAAHIAASLIQPKRGDKYTVFHISDSTKTHLPRHLTPQHLKHYYEDMAAHDKLGLRSEWVCREKSKGSTCKTLVQLVDERDLDLLVIGNFGRKGEKLDVLGSVSDYTLRMCRSSLCIVRSTGSRFDKQAKILFASDGSHAANLAFVLTLHYFRRPLDIVDVMFVATKDPMRENEWAEMYRRYMEAHQVPGNVEVKQINRTLDTTVQSTILEASRDVDILVVGVSGYSQKKMGSVSEFLSVHASCTTIVVKDALDILGPPIVTNAHRFQE
uniref:UspA domain-containing protein n=1 Tax=Dunaliella tertiolecta TaxID=3047 RepID=A0A7S3VLK8_DUNTE|mmetsp:Transcript_14196/g.38494  ORF Transcript_14196/g.38494 Transcript_14196/m.38494 type:complete len:311 (+) Transcript_14196:31-963(+)|eukprot:CAMPEP_0202377600 /NCGR_PEP_ID=MMETSP1127-20130417/11635_1 /ASSEMBLY_ACC=CAM_ASM_000462 /TAXON_ID=3047 /ORGANISM="Dunaliella tertiolecta, Strain CCMP1320" /LENGTH=310 /DNA_ID=CAMNT_0048975687 /DNA_START=31 /DNA_END=963 /DNA_ORIENTATION=+